MNSKRFLPAAALLVAAPFAYAAQAGTTQKVTVTMSEMMFMPMKLSFQAGRKVELTIVDGGRAPHEFQAYDVPKNSPSGEEAWDAYIEKHAWWLGAKDVKLTVNGKAKAGSFMEVNLKPGEKAVLTFTPTKKGTFEMACHYPGHYESGMKGAVTVK
ncbi:cupredoxin domain-containing protein [Deinococcus yavapaiensis]|uniref:Putative cupredoxin-like copper-binding protein n=1 Tax=Deinococcus yavapaiensis KR-236 TaxID=694435 RepID=A0A318S8G4_9DEIO|nr:cupredoxin domain-containing protein [Deinococcus yavapaiensis]PYE55346.1 putative cupredoxin-like copper-binding protein [Deinococcus yavapaiensis KR-236]